MTTEAAGAGAAAPEPQPVLSPLTGAAIFLVAVINPGPDSAGAVRDLCGDLAGLVRAVGFRGTEDYLTCVAGIGSEAWDRLVGLAPPGRAAPVP